MVYNTSEFGILADYIADNPIPNISDETRYRTAIGRYYYTCFHWCIQHIIKPKKKGKHPRSIKHREIRRQLSKIGEKDEEIAIISDAFDMLNVLRNHSDYHYWHPSYVSRKDGKHWCTCTWIDPETSIREARKNYNIIREILREKKYITS